MQFSTAAPGTAHFQPDPTRPARDALMEIYYHQRAFQQKHGRWAQSLDPLDLSAEVKALQPSLTTTGDRFRASVDIPIRGGAQATTVVRQDSRLRRIHPNDDLLDELESILSEQAAAWNRGDIDGFMQHYWKSEDLTFSSGGHTTRGWQTTKDGYKLRYPTRERMGHLTFDGLEVFPLGDSAALMLGHWHLDRNGPIGGNFSLVFRKIDGEWVIMHDHSSQRK